jgi:hypothetical protein
MRLILALSKNLRSAPTYRNNLRPKSQYKQSKPAKETDLPANTGSGVSPDTTSSNNPGNSQSAQSDDNQVNNNQPNSDQKKHSAIQDDKEKNKRIEKNDKDKPKDENKALKHAEKEWKKQHKHLQEERKSSSKKRKHYWNLIRLNIGYYKGSFLGQKI